MMLRTKTSDAIVCGVAKERETTGKRAAYLKVSTQQGVTKAQAMAMAASMASAMKNNISPHDGPGWVDRGSRESCWGEELSDSVMNSSVFRGICSGMDVVGYGMKVLMHDSASRAATLFHRIGV
jgi:hypothetical protein